MITLFISGKFRVSVEEALAAYDKQDWLVCYLNDQSTRVTHHYINRSRPNISSPSGIENNLILHSYFEHTSP